MAVETHVVDEGPVTVLIKEIGVVKPRQSVAVKSKVSGKVREVLVAEGDSVREGQLVAVVDPDAAASLTLSKAARLPPGSTSTRRNAVEAAGAARDGRARAANSEEAERDFRMAELLLQARNSNLRRRRRTER
jgi:multidrug efflux pump subunit AcrA (membrane-fusion protein)